MSYHNPTGGREDMEALEDKKERKRRQDHERYMRNREERLRRAKEYYRQNREKCIERVRMAQYRRWIKEIKHISE